MDSRSGAAIGAGGDADAPANVQAFCLALLRAPDLASKLRPPLSIDGAWLPDTGPTAPIEIARPARAPEIALAAGAAPLPRPGALATAEARASCLARFAHHELMAAELFAWALLRWPDLPAELRHGWLVALRDEQRHCGLYLARLRAHDSELHEHVLSDYFWKHVPAIAASPAGPSAFIAALGLTLEQANLDFTLLYRDAFREAGDEASAVVCQTVHDDEIRHVALAAKWLAELAAVGAGEIARYTDAVPFPLSAARAKGRRFDVAARRRAGLGEDFIEHVRAARSSQETQPARTRRDP